jgi:hypothetical protein
VEAEDEAEQRQIGWVIKNSFLGTIVGKSEV